MIRELSLGYGRIAIVLAVLAVLLQPGTIGGEPLGVGWCPEDVLEELLGPRNLGPWREVYGLERVDRTFEKRMGQSVQESAGAWLGGHADDLRARRLCLAPLRSSPPGASAVDSGVVVFVVDLDAFARSRGGGDAGFMECQRWVVYMLTYVYSLTLKEAEPWSGVLDPAREE